MIYGNLNDEIKTLMSFMDTNIDYFKYLGEYSNFFAAYILNINKSSISFLGDFRKQCNKELLGQGIQISKESFYLKIKKEVFDSIIEINKEFEKKMMINKEKFLDLIDDETDINHEIEMNNYNLKLICDLIDDLQENKNLVLGNIKKGNFSFAFENIQEFLDINSNNIKILMKESIYYEHFWKINSLIMNNSRETVLQIEKYIGEDLSENMSDNVVVNKEYYDEMKDELGGLVKDLNTLLITEKNN